MRKGKEPFVNQEVSVAAEATENVAGGDLHMESNSADVQSDRRAGNEVETSALSGSEGSQSDASAEQTFEPEAPDLPDEAEDDGLGIDGDASVFPKMPPKEAKAKKKHASKERRDYGETNLLIIKLLIVGGFVLLIALVVISIGLHREGDQAEAYANQLLEAYEANPPAIADTAAPTDTPNAIDTPEATVTPASSESPNAEGETLTPTPAVASAEQDAANAAAMETANEHLLDDASNDGVDESADYSQPEAPEEDEAEKIIESVVSKVGADGIIGVIEIPEIDIKLPVIGKWSYALLKISVCRYKGPNMNQKGNLVIIGHNYKSGAHFGNLDQLSVGSAIYLTGVDGTQVRYEVYDRETIEPDDFDALNEYKGTAGLTLMTCKNSGNSRLVVRCVEKALSIPDPR